MHNYEGLAGSVHVHIRGSTSSFFSCEPALTPYPRKPRASLDLPTALSTRIHKSAVAPRLKPYGSTPGPMPRVSTRPKKQRRVEHTSLRSMYPQYEKKRREWSHESTSAIRSTITRINIRRIFDKFQIRRMFYVFTSLPQSQSRTVERIRKVFKKEDDRPS